VGKSGLLTLLLVCSDAKISKVFVCAIGWAKKSEIIFGLVYLRFKVVKIVFWYIDIGLVLKWLQQGFAVDIGV